MLVYSNKHARIFKGKELKSIKLNVGWFFMFDSC